MGIHQFGFINNVDDFKIKCELKRKKHNILFNQCYCSNWMLLKYKRLQNGLQLNIYSRYDGMEPEFLKKF